MGILVVAIIIVIAGLLITNTVDRSKEKKQNEEILKTMQERIMLDGELFLVMKALIREAGRDLDAKGNHMSGRHM